MVLRPTWILTSWRRMGQLNDRDNEKDIAALSAQVRSLRWMMGGVCTVSVVVIMAGVSWAMSVQQNVGLGVPPVWFKAQVDDLEKRVTKLENE